MKTWGLAIVVAGVVIGGGFVLWAQHEGINATADSDLGSAVIGAGVVACAIFLLERRFGAIADRQASELATARREEAARHHAQLLTALTDQLPGVDLSERVLDGFYLRAKRMERADLTGCKLVGANLSRTVLSDAFLTGATLDRAFARAASFAGADLTDASLERADLTGVDLRRGARLSGADLSKAVLRGADLRGANLQGARNAHACNFKGARYDERTIWPSDMSDPPADTIEWRKGDPWKSEAELKAGDSSTD